MFFYMISNYRNSILILLLYDKLTEQKTSMMTRYENTDFFLSEKAYLFTIVRLIRHYE